MADDLDRKLQAAYAQQEHHQSKVRQNVEDMKNVLGGKKGGPSPALIKKIAIGTAAVVFLAMTAVMLSDPASRKMWFFFLFVLGSVGVFVYAKKQQNS